MAKHPVYVRLIHSRKWLALRRAYVSAHPLCERCLASGIYRSTQEVHHLRPVETGSGEQEMERLCYDPRNLQALCRDCHHQAHIELGSNTQQQRLARREADAADAVRLLYGEGRASPETPEGGAFFKEGGGQS